MEFYTYNISREEMPVFDTLRVLSVYIFWLILGFVLFYDSLSQLTFDFSVVKKWFKSLTEKPKKVENTETPKVVGKPWFSQTLKSLSSWVNSSWKTILSWFKSKPKQNVKKADVKTTVIKPVKKVGRKEKALEAVTPVVQTKFLTAEDSQDEDDDMEDVTFFADTLVERPTFYPSLKGRIKDEFDRLFVLETEDHVVPTLVYTVGGQNEDFFADVFKFIFRYRKLISLELLQRLLEELLSMTADPASMTLLYEAFIRVAYARRQQKGFLDAAKAIAEKDVKLHQDVLNTKDAYIYSFVRLAIILERQQRIDEALQLVQDAIARGLEDKTTTKFEGRRSRLLNKKNK